jgi:hypothetical protein
VSAAEIILDPPHEASSWEIGEMLISQRRWGATRCRKFLIRNQISEIKPLVSLTERQRRLLASQLGLCPAAEESFSPAKESFSPAKESFAPAKESFAPARESFSPAGESFSPAEESFSPAERPFSLAVA